MGTLSHYYPVLALKVPFLNNFLVTVTNLHTRLSVWALTLQGLDFNGPETGGALYNSSCVDVIQPC
jgi:hypothetical protein